MKNKRTRLLAFIAILIIVGGTIGAIRSLPLYSLYNSIKQGGVVVEDKVNIIEGYNEYIYNAVGSICECVHKHKL